MPSSPALWTAGAAASLLLLAGCSGGSTQAAGVVSAPSVTASAASPATTPTPADPPPTPTPTVKRQPTPTPTAAHRAVTSARYVFPVRCSTAISYGHSHHDYPATDIFAAVGCSVVAPVSGTIDEVSRVDRWSPSANLGSTRGGLSFSIVGVDGVRYYGSHLSSLLAGIRPGVRVVAGELIGKVGRTGDARGGPSHLHFGISWPTGPGIWWVRRGEVYPWPYLDAWRDGIAKSPAAAVAARERQVGDAGCTADC